MQLCSHFASTTVVLNISRKLIKKYLAKFAVLHTCIRYFLIEQDRLGQHNADLVLLFKINCIIIALRDSSLL